MTRRAVLVGALAGAATTMLGGAAAFGTAGALARPPGSPLQPADANGWRLPAGFRSRVVAVTGRPVGPDGYRWHRNPDGGAAFARPGGGWIYVSNAEVHDGGGGASMVRFDAGGSVVEARSLLDGSSMNCSGGPTPWGTYLSCEEIPRGRVWELDPTGARPPVVREALGRFQHEGLAVDADRGAIYLSEDRPDGGLYRFRADRWPDLGSGTLQVLAASEGGGVRWATVPDPSGTGVLPHGQRRSMIRFDGGEGIWYRDDTVYLTTKGDGRVWKLELVDGRLGVLYDPASHPNPQLNGVDQAVLAPWGDLIVAEDGGNMELVLVHLDGAVSVLAQLTGVAGSELTGLAFDPSGTRLYVSSQRNPGVTYELTGPFPGATQRFDDLAAAVAATGPWATWSNDRQVGGAARVTTEPGAALRCTVVGPVLRVLGHRGPDRAVLEVRVGGEVVAQVDTYATTNRSRQVLFATSSLGGGSHHVELRHGGRGSSAEVAPALVIDAIEAAALG
jgi:secreted PhoX family phosphatase